MSFWKNKPVSVKRLEEDYKARSFSSHLIVTADTLLENSSKEIQDSRIQLEYDLIMDPNDYERSKMLEFINKNYGDTMSDLILSYSKELFDSFIKPDSLCIVFYTVGNRNPDQLNFNKMIGLIIAKKHQLFIRNFSDKQTSENDSCFKTYNCIDVDFLCLIKQLRNLSVSSYMINVVTKECIIQYNKTVPCAVYTVNKQLKSDSFCKKSYFHRPINIENMLASEMLSISGNDQYTYKDSLQLLKRVYNSFSYPRDFFQEIKLRSFTVLDKFDPCKNDCLFADKLYDKLVEYNSIHYDIFEYKSKDEFVNLLNNPVYLKFVTLDKDNNVLDFLCLFKLDTCNIYLKTKSRNGNLYSMFLDNYSNTRLSYLLEAITEYCYKNDIYDVITVMNIFNAKSDSYNTFKLLKASADLYYYVYNIEVTTILPHKNGLITI
jgi:hypothetical protein